MSKYNLKNQGKQKVIVKVKPNIPKKERNKNTDKKKPLKKVKKDKDDTGNEKSIRYNTHPDMVERLIVSNKEYIKFNFNDTDEMKNIKSCDVELTVVARIGDEYPNEFKLKDNYESIIDKSSGQECTIENNLIKNIKINKGIAQIELKLKPNYNKALKFGYYVEV